MNRIADLTGQIAALPEKAKLRDQLGALQAMRNKLAEHTQDYARQRRRAAAIARVPSTNVTKALEHLDAAVGQARTLTKLLGKDGAIGAEADRSLTQLVERVANAATLLTSDWRAYVSQRIQRYTPLVNAAERANLPGTPALAAALRDLSDFAERPPESPEQAARFASAAEAVPTAIAALGLTGPVGELVIKATRGTAKLRDLDPPEVKTFLAANPTIADMFRVTLV